MRWRDPLSVLAGAASVALAAGMIMIGTAGAAPAAARLTASALPTGQWGFAHPISLAGLNQAIGGSVDALSCPSPGNCTAAGDYTDVNSHHQAFVATETNFIWGRAMDIPGLPVLNVGNLAKVTSLSCASAGNCAAGGFYAGAPGNELQPFVADSVQGAWSGPHLFAPNNITMPEGLGAVNSLSCTSPGNCVAAITEPLAISGPGGTVSAIVPTASVGTEVNGSWDQGQPVADALGQTVPEEITSVSCSSAGNCVAGGYYSDGSPQTLSQQHKHAMAVVETNGSWGTAEEVPRVAGINDPQGNAKATSVACLPSGECAVGGFVGNGSSSTAFISTEAGQNWDAPVVPEFSFSTFSSQVLATSCGAPRDCAAVGTFRDDPLSTKGFVVADIAGARAIAREAAINLNEGRLEVTTAVSCAAAGTCVAGGFYTDFAGHQQSFTVSENGGIWGTPQQAAGVDDGAARVNAVSCPSAGNCVAAGFADDAALNAQPFVIEQSTASFTSLSLTASRIMFGREGREILDFQVRPHIGGTPTGSVTVTAGPVVICTGTLVNGSGSCALSDSQLRPGRYPLTATYSGDQTYDGSASPPQTITVARARTTTTLALSAAKVRFGHEQAERLSVQVGSHVMGIITGKVIVAAASTTLCVITLDSAKGSCTLHARSLRPGTYQLTASYRGAALYARSISAEKTLTVTR